jgi:hypothetical protein
MTLAVFFVILSALALVALVFLAKGHWFGRAAAVPHPSELQPIDVEAFRNLIDESEEEYLRETLHGREFRRIHRERMMAAVEYVRGAYRNAGILVQIAQAAKESPDPAVASAAERLFEGAIQLRLYAFQVIPTLYVSAFFPGRSRAPQRLLERYDTLTRHALVLSCMGSTGV